MLTTMKKSSQNGFSLISVMVAASIGAGLLVAIMQMNEIGQKNIKTSEVKSELIHFHDQVLSFLKDQDNCNATFGGLYFDTSDIKVHRSIGISQEDGVNYMKTEEFDLSKLSSHYELVGLKVLNPLEKNLDRMPASAKSMMEALPKSPSLNGWDTLVEFHYRLKPGRESQKGFNQKEIKKYHSFRFNNATQIGLVANPGDCAASSASNFYLSGHGKNYLVQEMANIFTPSPSTEQSIAPCYDLSIETASGNNGTQYIKECAML
jgi:hypothetical protein